LWFGQSILKTFYPSDLAPREFTLHFSANPRPAHQMDDFRQALANCDLSDLGFSVLPYTYDNDRSGTANVRVRLDRAVADPAWKNFLIDTRVHHLVSSRSDHCPLLVDLRKDVWERRGSRLFRYEVMWDVWIHYLMRSRQNVAKHQIEAT
jgi:hypothetical protein